MKKRHLIPAVGAALVAAYLYGQATGIGSAMTQVVTDTAAAATPPPEKVEVSPVILIQAMEEKFETITFSMNLTADKVTAGRCDGNWWQDFWWRDCLKIQVPGTVNAGFGREILDPTRVTRTKETVTFDLGEPMIYPQVYIDHARVTVTNPDDTPGLLANANKNLQAEGFTKAEQKLRQAACEAHILQAAALAGQAHYGELLRNILRAAGDVRVVKITYTIPEC